MATRIGLTRKALFIAVPLFILLALAVGYSVHVWTQIGDGAGMDGDGVGALVIGAIGSSILGGGLMALVFFSSRRGYDDAATLRRRDDGELPR